MPRADAFAGDEQFGEPGFIGNLGAGAAGNDAPLVSTSEAWTAVAVGLNGLLVREIRDDPRSGKTTRELTSLSQNDPDPATFQPPEGYEIVTKDASGCQGEPTPRSSTEAAAERTTSK